jgi:hypothetical protein
LKNVSENINCGKIKTSLLNFYMISPKSYPSFRNIVKPMFVF